MHTDQKTSSVMSLSGPAYAGAVATSLGAALAFAAAFLLRGGLGDSSAAIAILYLLAIAPIWLSAWALSRFGGAFAAMTGAMLGTLLPLLGFVAAPLAAGSTIIVLLLGLWGALQASAWRVRGDVVVIALLTGALLILLTAPSRLYMQEALLLGTANSDNYLHAANMQKIGRASCRERV